MELTLTSKHELLGTGYFIGIDSENLSEQLIIAIEPEELLDKWAYIEFQVNDGEKYNTPRLDIVENKITYDIPNGLLQKGYVTIQIVFRDNDKVIWKSFKKKFHVSDAINACQGLPEEYPDFITEAQILLDEVSIEAAKIDEVIETEAARVEAENTRVINENTRMASENERKSAETDRLDKEVERIANEASRQSNEVSRVNAESTREAKFNTWENTLGVLDNLSNALKNTASGEVIRVDDVSPVEHNAKVKVQGKNMFSILKPADKQSTYRSWLVNPDGKMVTLSITDKDTSVNIAGMFFGFCANGIDGKDGVIWLVENGEVKRRSYTLADYSYISIYEATDEVVNALASRFNIQLELGNTATEYTPYVDPASATVTKCGKNLFPYPFNGSTSSNGITFIDNGDGSITLNGTNNREGNSAFYITKDTYISLPSSTYIGSPDTSDINIVGVEKGGGYLTLNKVLNTETDISLRSIYIQVKKGNTTTFNNVTIYPQLELGNTKTDYEAYKGETYTPNADGTLTTTSTAPTMTLLTDKSGVSIDLEYNRDINKVIKNLEDKINALTK